MVLPHRRHINGDNFPWVVLINGLFTDQDSWNDSVESLKEFNILTYDGKGQGQAPTLKAEHTLDDQVRDLAQLIDHVKLKRFSLVGLSNGGRVALKFSSLFPEKIISLVACDTYGSLTPLLKLKIESWLKAQENGGATHRFDVATPWVWGEELVESKPELVKYYREKASNADNDNIKSLISGALSGHVSLETIKAPTLFVAGEEDLLTPVFHHKKMVSQVENSKLEIVPGGHASLIEHPESFSKYITPFLRSHNVLG